MRIASGRVVDGKVVVDGEPLVEGETVTILSRAEEEFELDPQAERELLAALAEAHRREGMEGEAFLAQLDAE